MPPCGSWQCVQREYRRPHSPAPHSSTPSVFNRNIPSPAAFLGWTVFLCTMPLSLLSRSRRTGAKKAALRQCFYGRFLGKVSLKLLRCIIVEACQVGDYRSYYRLMHSAPAPAHTPAQPDHRRQPMRWKPLRKGIPCGTGDSCDARCGFAPPGTNAGTKARIRYLFSTDYRNGSVSQECSPAVRGSRVYG